LLFALVVPIFTIVITLAIFEVVLRFFPVPSGMRAAAVNADNPVFHFMPNRPFVHSLGWTMHNVTRGRINNAGFVNDSDYRRGDPSPLLAVIGDSYIEARMVPFAETLQGRLARMLSGHMRVYSFAAGGAPLSQYLIWAENAVRTYGAHALIINVVGNDFDESLPKYKVGPGFWFYVPDERGELRLRLSEHHPGWMKELARRSALARYLTINLAVHRLINDPAGLGALFFASPAKAETHYAGNTDAAVGDERVRASLGAINAFFRDLPIMTGLPPESILFTVDGFRYPEIAQAAHGSYFDVMRRAFLREARELGYEAIDLDERFFARYSRTGERYEFADDAHWNGVGHGVAAEAAGSSGLFSRLQSFGDGRAYP